MFASKCITHLWIPLPDGTRLAARLWLPDGDAPAALPALIEYLPYRKSDGTAPTDPVRHAWFAAHGFDRGDFCLDHHLQQSWQ